MKLQWNTSLRMTLCTMAVVGASFAHAQAQPAAPDTPVPHAAQADAKKHAGKKMHKQHSAEHKNKKHAKPAHHEAADKKRTVGPNDAEATEYQRNAFKRCDIFKTDEDRKACVDRVRHSQASGSVEGGGIMREHKQTAHPKMGHPKAVPLQK